MNLLKILPITALAFSLAGLAHSADNDWVEGTDKEAVRQVLEASFSAHNDVTLDRLEQSDMQRACSEAERTGAAIPRDVIEKITEAARASIQFPEDGEYFGDWREGEKIAQSGRGLQWSDKPGAPRGGNCYACHEMSKAELSFGNIGTSLLHYGKIRGDGKEMLEYTWSRIYNPHAFDACSVMPRFGDEGILTEAQMKHIMALLFDPESPVNDDSVDPKAK